MLADDKLGLKIAEDEEEGFWNTAKKQTETEIKALRKSLMFNEAILVMINIKIKDLGR